MYPIELKTDRPAFTHYMTGTRKQYLARVLQKLEELIQAHRAMHMDHPWYDGLFLLEDCDETLGFVFVACQTYIVGTIADVHGSKSPKALDYKNKVTAMKNDVQFMGQRTRIELINALANYFKHKDEGEPQQSTKEILDAYQLLSEEFPLYKGFELLAPDYKMESLEIYLQDWRNHLFNSRC